MPQALNLLNTYLGNSEKFIWNTLTGLKKYKPVVLASEIKNLDTYPLKNGKILSCRPFKSIFASITARIRNRYSPLNYNNCYQEISQEKCKIIHAHYGYRGIVSMNLASKLNLPFIVNFYGYDLSNHEFLDRANEQYKQLFNQGSAFIVEGPKMKEKLLKLKCPEEKIHLHPISLDPHSFTFKERSWNRTRPVQFLFVGRLVPKKGLITALQAFKRIDNTFPWNLKIIGDGPELEKLKTFTKDYLPKNSVEFLGLIDSRILSHYYDQSDIIIQPSQKGPNNDSEGGAPTVLLEAQASGLPIISTRHDDIPFVVRENKNAFLCDEYDIRELANNILKMVENHHNWGEMGRIGLENIKTQHDINNISIKLESLYDSF